VDRDAFGLLRRQSSSTCCLQSAGMMTSERPHACRQELLLDAADRQHIAAQRNLAVIASSGRTGLSVSRLTSAVAMVTPALGPSLGSHGRHVDVDVDVFRKVLIQAQRSRVRPHPRQRRLHRFFITSPICR